MSLMPDFPAAPETPWYAAWFDTHHYHRLYAHRDDREAAAFVDALVAHLRPAPGATMLDVGCGAGRHARALAAHGFDVTGFDLAGSSIREARQHVTPSLRFFRHDMRRPFRRRRGPLEDVAPLRAPLDDDGTHQCGAVIAQAHALAQERQQRVDHRHDAQVADFPIPVDLLGWQVRPALGRGSGAP